MRGTKKKPSSVLRAAMRRLRATVATAIWFALLATAPLNARTADGEFDE